MSGTPILEIDHISKHYPGVQALQKVSLTVNVGEVRALLGKNGAGKSTLIKILSGATTPDEGEIRVDGAPVHITSPTVASTIGIGTVYQEMSLVPGLTVAENILLGRWPLANRIGVRVINRREALRQAQAALDMMGASLRPNTLVADLTVPERQIVEIAKALSFKPKVLVLDEPTSSLPQSEVEQLLKLVRQLAANGVAIIYVSHRLQEIPRVADSITVLREGRLIGTIPVGEASPDVIARMMIGEGWNKTFTHASSVQSRKVLLSAEDINIKGHLRGVSFDLHEGEVLGIAGLLGSGRTELLESIVGMRKPDSGTISIDGEKIRKPRPDLMRTKGVGLTPEDRKLTGLVMPLSVEHNLVMSSMNRISSRGVLSPAKSRELAKEMVDKLSVATSGLDTLVSSLSGGNQQKIVIGKWLNAQARLLLMDEPTRGIDIQAKDQVYRLVRELAQQGVGIIFVSSELEEVLEVSDRILILNHGRITAELPGADAKLEQVLALAMAEV
ncbi:MAG: sugar ABC transporter ATP-binding protein [Anaerolineae bacterium]